MTELRQLLIGDGPNLDSFSRLRVSQPTTLFDAQFTYALQPLLYEPTTANGGSGTATIAHDSTNRCALHTFTGVGSGAKAIMQTFDHMRYQPGKSQLIFVTFNMEGGVANTKKFAGYSDGFNGVEFLMDGIAPKIQLLSDTGHGDESVAQADWSLDPMDGNGPSGIVLDFTKVQILVIDLQALYVGRVRVGWDIGGSIVYCHEFNHANVDTVPYVQSASLPVRCGMTASGSATTTMRFVCCSVISEGGQDDTTGYFFSQEGTATAASGARTHLLSVRPKATFNSIANRSKWVLESADIVVTGNNPVKWELCLGDVITGTTTFADVNATYSATEFNTAGTTSAAPAIVIAQGYVGATSQSKQAISQRVAMRYPITLDAAGTARALGTLTVLATGIGGTSATRAVLNWREIR